MILLLAAWALAPTDPSALFDASVANLGRLKQYSVHIDSYGAAMGKTQQFQFDLSVSGADGLLRVREPATGILDRSDRSYLARGAELLAYDAVADERLKRPLRAGASLESRLASQLGPLDLSVRLWLSPDNLRKFLAEFRGFKDWVTTTNGDLVTLQRSVKGASTMFRFEGSQPLLNEVQIEVKGSVLHWIFTFHPRASLALAMPGDARKVSSFMEREAPPKYASQAARAVVERMMKAYGRLQNGVIDVSSGAGASRIVLSGRWLREDLGTFSWAYDGSILTMHNKRTRKFYRGKAVRVILSEYVTKAGGGVDPLIHSIVGHTVPYQDLFPKEATVKQVGTAGSDDVLDVKSPWLRLSLFVNRDTHLLDSMEAETRDKSGQVLSRSTRRFQYSGLGISSPLELFRLSAGLSKVLPLPKVNELGGR